MIYRLLRNAAVVVCLIPISLHAAGPVETMAYRGVPTPLPGTFEAEDFDNGGEGAAYHDGTPGNSGGMYRGGDVDIEMTADGGFDVGWTESGEWLNYTVNVTAPGEYTVQLRVASLTGGWLHVGFSDSSAWEPVWVPATGGWQAWTTTEVPVNLQSGVQVFTVFFDSGGTNLDAVSVVAGVTAADAAFGPSSHTIPGTLQASDFDYGGDGIAYHDLTPGNEGGAYRSTDVDVQPSSESSFNVGWIQAGEWLRYTVTVSQPGTYTAAIRVAAPAPGGTFHLDVDGDDVSGPIVIPDTGGWQQWETIVATVSLPQGLKRLRLVFDVAGSSGVLGNIEWMTFTAAAPDLPPTDGEAGTTVGQDANNELPAIPPRDDQNVPALGVTSTLSFTPSPDNDVVSFYEIAVYGTDQPTVALVTTTISPPAQFTDVVINFWNAIVSLPQGSYFVTVAAVGPQARSLAVPSTVFRR